MGKKGKSKQADGPGLSRADSEHLIAQLKSIREKVIRYEAEREQEKRSFQIMREQMRTELLELKKVFQSLISPN